MELLEEYKIQLAELLRSSRLLDVDTNEEKRRILKRLQCPVSVLRLFHYYRPNTYAFDDLRVGRITLANPNEFNDPFDSLLYVDEDKVKSAVAFFDKDFLERQIKLIRTGKYIDGSLDFGLQEFLKKFALSSDVMLGQKSDALCDLVKENGINIAMGVMPRLLRRRNRICCFSEDSTSALMWAHYADASRGFCVEYEIPTAIKYDGSVDSLNRPLSIITLPVLYSCQRYDATHIIDENAQIYSACAWSEEPKFDTSNHDRLATVKIAVFKSSAWNYEREWRVFAAPFFAEDPDYVTMPVPRIKSVIIGHAMSKENQEKIDACVRDLAATHHWTIDIKCLIVDTKSKDYALRTQDVGTIGPDSKLTIAANLRTLGMAQPSFSD